MLGDEMKCASTSENWNCHITRSVSWPWRSASNRALARWLVPGDNTCWRCWNTAHGCLLTLQQNKNHIFFYLHYMAKCCDLSVIFKMNKFWYVIQNRADTPSDNALWTSVEILRNPFSCSSTKHAQKCTKKWWYVNPLQLHQTSRISTGSYACQKEKSL